MRKTQFSTQLDHTVHASYAQHTTQEATQFGTTLMGASTQLTGVYPFATEVNNKHGCCHKQPLKL